jgi:ABC-type nitrate/sulfonate/bicarbonate transport system permease component
VVVGWALGSALGFGVALAIDRLPFLQRGLLPVASLTSTIPLVAVAPIMVMWFGFEWPSKAAVVTRVKVETTATIKLANSSHSVSIHNLASTSSLVNISSAITSPPVASSMATAGISSSRMTTTSPWHPRPFSARLSLSKACSN